MKPPQKSLCKSNRHQARYHQQRSPVPVPLPPLRCYLLLWHPCIKGCLQPKQVQDMVIGIMFWQERVEEPGLFSLAEQRLRGDVIAVYKHQRLRNYKEELFRLKHNFDTITNAYNKVAVHTVRLGVRRRFQDREISCH